MVVVSTT